MLKNLLAWGAGLLLSASIITGCGSAPTSGEKSPASPNGEEKSAYVVTDIQGREVRFEKVPNSAAVIGHGGLKIYTYVCGDNGLIGVEDIEKRGRTVTGQSFHHAYPNIRNLDTVGKGGPEIVPDHEQLAYKKPEVIFAAYQSKDEMDTLQAKLNIPVVGLLSGSKDNIFNEEVYQTFAIVGKTMNRTERAEEIIRFLKETQNDLQKRAGGAISGPRVYMGGCSFRGEQGILSTKEHVDLLDTVKVNNVMNDLTKEKGMILDKEKLLEIDPELILLDLSGKKRILGELEKDPRFFDSLTAFQQGETYAIMPYFTYGMNFDTALLDMYYIGKLTHPDGFTDIDIEAKAKEIYTLFVGKNVYDELRQVYPEAFKKFQRK